MIKFPSIESFRHLRKKVELRTTFAGFDENGAAQFSDLVPGSLPTLSFRGTTKLHGSNAGIVRKLDGTLVPQSRGRELSLTEDNFGFAKFVLEEIPADEWETLFRCVFGSACDTCECVLYGEVCGKGVQSKVGVCNLDRRIFVLFKARIANPVDGIREWLPLSTNLDLVLPHSVYNVNSFGFFEVDIDFNDPESAQANLTNLTLRVEESCPVATALGVGGVGEGIVWECTTAGYESSDYWFKTKGEKHKGSSKKTNVEIDPEKVASVNDFVAQVVTEARCRQGIDFLKEMGHPLSRKSTGHFLKWVNNDILKEEHDVLEASGLSKKDVNGPVSNFARTWLFNYLDSQ